MLKDIDQIAKIDGGAFIYSMWSGYLQEKSMETMLEWIRKSNLAFHSVHTSGHASINTLKKVVHELKPQRIIPIHTFFPEQYASLGADVEAVSDGDFLRKTLN